MQAYRQSATLLLLCLTLVSCSREMSREERSYEVASGRLLSVNVKGDYVAGNALTDSNYLAVTTTVFPPGNYTLWTDTLDGYWFRVSGYISSSGTSNFHVPGYGAIKRDTSASFILHFDTSQLGFSVILSSAIYGFDAPVGSCPVMQVFGPYKQNIALTTADYVRIPIVVTSPGKYNIRTTAVDYMSFSDSGTLSHTGRDTLTLHGVGMPSNTGAYPVPVTVGGNTCNFNIIVNPQIDTTMYWQFTVEGVVHRGYIPDSLFIDGTPKTITSINIQGKVLPDSTNSQYVMPFELEFGRIQHDITTGTYTPSALPYNDFFAVFDQSHATTATTYTATSYLPGFSVQLLEIDTSSGLVRGTFSGPVHKTADANPFFPQENNTPIVYITDGFFQGYLKKQ